MTALIPLAPEVRPEVEVLERQDVIGVWCSPLGFAPVQSRRYFEVPQGTSIEEIVQQAQPNPVRRRFTQVYLGTVGPDSYIALRFWARVRPRVTVYVRTLPGDDVGARGFVTLAIIAVSVFLPQIAPLTFAAGSTGGILLAVGSAVALFAANALIKPPSQKGGAIEQLQQISSFSTFRNRIDPWGLFERPIGTCRIYPAFLAEPYTEIVNEQQWVRMVFAGWGPCEFDDWRFGNTSVDQLRRVKIRHTQGWPESPVTFTAADVDVDDNKIRLPGHPYIRNNPVRFRNGTPPPPLENQTTYWIVSRTKNAVKVSNERGGEPIILTGQGTGCTIFRREPRPKIYPGVVFPQPANITLEENKKHIFTTQPGTDEAKLIFFFGQGLGKFDDKNPEDLDHQTVQVRVRFRKKVPAGDPEKPWSNSDVTDFPATKSPRIPRPDRLRKRINGSWTKVESVAVYAVFLDPDSGKLEVSAPTVSEAEQTGPGRKPPAPPGGERGKRAHGVPPFPPEKIPIALVTRRSDDNNKINPSEIQDMRPTVRDTDVPLGVTIGKGTDFQPRPTSPRKQKIRVRRGTVKKVALVVRAKKRKQFFRDVTLDFPKQGEYEIEVTRVNSAGGKGVFDEVKLQTVQSFTNDNILDEAARRLGLWLVEVKAPSQNNLENIVDRFNVLATSIFQSWDGQEWSQKPTNNVADCVRGIIQGPGALTPIPDSRLVLEDFQEFADWCEDRGFTCGQIVDFATTVLEQASDIAAVGRGSLSRVDLNVGITIDRLKTNRVTNFARHNIVKDSLRVDLPFTPLPHGFRVRFRNEKKDYNFDEALVFGDGHDEENHDPDKIEVLSAPMITRPKHAKLYGRYFWLVAKHRRKRFSWATVLHAFAQRHGDLNGLNHDTAFFGSGSARVTAVGTSGGNVDTVTLSTPVIMEFGKLYRIQFTKADAGPPPSNRILVEDVDTVVGEQSVLTLSTPPPIADGPAVDEMLVFGEVGKEVVEVVNDRITPLSPYRARFEAWELAPQIFAVDGEQVDDLVSPITIPADIDRPVVLGVFSDESAARIIHDGSIELAIKVSIQPPSSLSFFATRLEAQIREKPEDDALTPGAAEKELAPWTDLAAMPIGVTEVRFPQVRSGLTYQIRLRYASDQTPGAEWTAILEHTAIGLSTPPPDVLDLFATLDELNWQFDNPPLDLAGFRIRAHFGNIADWGSAAPLHPQDQPIKTTPFSVTNLRGTGRRTLLVKAVDVAENESVNPAAVLFDFGIPAFANVVLRTDYHPAFPGVIVNGIVTAGKLESASGTAHWLGAAANANEPYWRANVAYPIWQVQFPRMSYEADFLPSNKASLTIESTVNSPDGHQIEIRKDLVAPLWPSGDSQVVWAGATVNPGNVWWDATPGQYFNVPGSLDVEVQDHTIRLTAFTSARKTTVSTLSAVLDVPDVIERLIEVAIPAAGVRLALSKSFTAITEVKPTLQTGGTAVKIDVIDLDPVNGPLVAGVAAGGARVPATGDFVVIGYRLSDAAA